MRTRITYFALLTLLLTACLREEPFSSQKTGEGIVLDLVLEEHQTKATRDGEDALHENVIASNLDIFFYNESTGVITKEVLNIPRSGNRIEIQTNPNDIEGIFGTIAAGAKCGVFIVSNFTGTYEGTAGSRTLSEIKSSIIQAPSFSSGNAFVTQDNFVLTGQQQLTLGNAQGATPVYGTVGLERVAAKVTFDVTVAETVGEGGGWVPQTENGAMTVYMVYPMRKATLGADAVDMPVNANVTYGSGEAMLYSQSYEAKLWPNGTTKPRQRKSGETTTTVNSPVYTTLQTSESSQVLPFYTYPCQWETGSSMEPYMKLIIPWHNINTSKYYYKIPFAGNKLERNHWYHISIDVQILGTEQAEPPEVTITYAIADWSGELDTSEAEEITSITSVPATVISAKYLNVPTTEYVLYDEDQLVIPIQSSSDVEVVGFNVDESNAYNPTHMADDANYVGTSLRLYNPYLTTLNTSVVNAVRPNYKNDPPTPVASNSGWTISVNGRESISVSHTLNRSMSSDDFDVAPYTMRFRIRHTSDSDNYFSDVIIEQRPSIIIQPKHNSDTGDILPTASGRGKGHTTEDGYVFINGVRTNTDMSIGRSNTNFNMYVVETSVLPTDESSVLSDFVLGDPRVSDYVSTTSGKTSSNFATGADITGGNNRKMEYYYPTAEDNDHKYFVAPSFRVASSFGTSSSMTRNDAIWRCAVYQEDGYPAGRWRLPSEAEVFYMITLSQKNKIPVLFSAEDSMSAGGYWSANGVVFPLNDGSVETCTIAQASDYNGGKHWARCVYDEWYWDDTKYVKAGDKTVFTWGDQKRSDVRIAED